ncbi:MAG: hypothetical protein K2I93_00880, partial [Oscillospiraceae bacterium]|nr:hypothetical protein [Oscillospiraceae bacterium]
PESETLREKAHQLKILLPHYEQLDALGNECDSLREQTAMLQQAFHDAAIHTEKLKQQLASERNALQQLAGVGEEKARLEAERNKQNERIEALKVLEDDLKKWQEAESALNEAAQSFLDAQKMQDVLAEQYRTAQETREQLEKKRDKLSNISTVGVSLQRTKEQQEKARNDVIEALKQLQSYAEKEAALADAQKLLIAAKETYAEKAAALESVRASLKAAQEEYSSLSTCKEQQIMVTQEQKTLEDHIAALAEIETALLEWQEQCRAAESAKMAFTKAQTDYQNAHDTYERANTEFLNNQAGILAVCLKPGCKCPVCGSLEHPEPAHMSDTALTKKELQALREKVALSRIHLSAPTRQRL